MNEQKLIQNLNGLNFFIFINYQSGCHYNALYDVPTFLDETKQLFAEELSEDDAIRDFADFKTKFLEFAEQQINNLVDVNDFWFELENTTWITVTFNPKFGSRSFLKSA